MKALKRFTASLMLGLALVLSGVQSAAAQCFAVYEYVGTFYGSDGSVTDIYAFRGVLCLAAVAVAAE